MRFTFTILVIVAATLTSAAIIPRRNVSRINSGGFRDEPSSRREVEGRQGRAHPRASLLFPDNADIQQRRAEDAYPRRHPRDFPRREPEPYVAVGNESRTPSRRHPRDFPRREALEADVEVRTSPGRIHARQFRSLD
ncbi:hypothetical protein B0H13DRAFT_829518 [Mycena leptocephala]|nr:hypothetical protein B0H13DRAFT_829518 [Mycena leptocephala]